MQQYILEKLTVGFFGCNCYLIGTKASKRIFIIDPGAEPDLIVKRVHQIGAIPSGVILTHGHPDHTGALKQVRDEFDIPVLYNKKEYNNGGSIKADRWLKEGDVLKIGDLRLHILETGGHSPGGISLYSTQIRSFRNERYEGIIFTGDLIFRRSVGRTDLHYGDKRLLFKNIREKIIYNPQLSHNTLVLAGHMGLTTIKEEKRLNPFGKLFLTSEDWKNNIYYGKNLDNTLGESIENRP